MRFEELLERWETGRLSHAEAAAPLVLTAGHELKLVYPQNGLDPETFAHLRFERFSLQPMDGPQRDHNTELAARYCREHPRWHLSLQLHKLLGVR